MQLDKTYNIVQNSWANNVPRSLMLHTSAGGVGMEGVYNTLLRRGLSYNYGIREGKVYEFVPWQRCAWHAGVIKRPNIRARAFYKTLVDEDNPNRNSVGIFFDQRPGSPSIPEEDVDAFVELSKWLGSETGYRYKADNIFGHIEVTADKPPEVLNYRTQCLEGLIGDKDMKDVGETPQAELLRRVLIEIIRRKWNELSQVE